MLLANRGYTCEPFLLTPFTDSTPAQEAYNNAHSSIRSWIEQTFCFLKERFQCLHHLRVSPERACDITVACAVLHNVACMRKEREPRVHLEDEVPWDNPPLDPDDHNGRLVRE